MNESLQAPILGCISEVVYGEMSEAVRARESSQAGSDMRERERENFRRCRKYIGTMPCDRLQMQGLFLHGTNLKCTGTGLLCPIRFPSLFNIPSLRDE